jgi:mRNA interferase MazF
MPCSRNEVVLLPLPFTDLSSRKVRPAVVIGRQSQYGDLFIVPITSQLSNTDVPLQDWQAAGLNVPCGIKAQLATFAENLVLKSVGRLSARDQAALDGRLREWLAL